MLGLELTTSVMAGIELKTPDTSGLEVTGSVMAGLEPTGSFMTVLNVVPSRQLWGASRVDHDGCSAWGQYLTSLAAFWGGHQI